MGTSRNWTDRLFEARDSALHIQCRGCGVDLYIPPSQVKQRAYCTMECKKTNRPPNVEQWARRISEPRKAIIVAKCQSCAADMHLPLSKADRRFCDISCERSFRKTEREKRRRECQACGKAFYPRQSSIDAGHGKFCSQKCNAASGRISSPENLLAAQNGRRMAIEEGRLTFVSGPDHPQWQGGPKGLRERQIASGKSAAWLRRYRAKNPDKVKEFCARRKHRVLGRLPRGTIPRIRKAQGDRCAICSVSLKRKGHVDHIIPVSKGGKHAASNIQLLCAGCNLRKSDKDPIEYMQSLGRLL